MAVAMDAAVASIGNDHDVKLKYIVELRALNIQHMKNTLMVQLCAFPGSPNHETTKSPNSRCLCSGMGTHVWEFRLSIHIQVVRFRYSDSGIQVWNSDLGIQDWVYRLADKYKALTFSIHIQGIQVHVFTFRHSGLGIQAWVYRQVCTPKPEL